MVKSFTKTKFLLSCSIYILSCGLLMATSGVSFAATDDNAFNDCVREYGHGNDMLEHQVWRNGRPPTDIDAYLSSIDRIEVFEKWTEEKNKNGTETIIVLARGKDGLEDEDSQDGFFIFLRLRNHWKMLGTFAANAAFFSKESSHGVYGFLFCTQEEMDSVDPLLWDGKKLQ